MLPRPRLVAAEQRLALAKLLSDRLAVGTCTAVHVEVNVDLAWRVAAALPPPNAGTLVAVDPLERPGDNASPWRVLVTSCDSSEVVLTLQWTGPGSRDRLDTQSLPPGTSRAFSIAGWLGRDCDFITVPQIVARAGGARETWDVRLTADDRLNPSVVVDVPRETAAPRPVSRDCRIQRAAELLQTERVEEEERHRRAQEWKLQAQQERQREMDALAHALAPYRPPEDAVASPEWQAARGLTLPELKGFHEEDHPYEYDVKFSEAWAVPTQQDAAFAVVYKVSATLIDRYGGDTFTDACRWVLHPVVLDGNVCTGWGGDPAVLFRTGSVHALPPSLATMA